MSLPSVRFFRRVSHSVRVIHPLSENIIAPFCEKFK